MARPRKGPAVLSRSRNIRLHHEEDQALIELAADLGQPPSRIIRRLIREAINGGPDYFQDGLLELRRMRAELAAIGGNLNQLTRAANAGHVLNGADVRAVTSALLVQVEAVQALYYQAHRTTRKRAVVPLRLDAGGSEPQGSAGRVATISAPARRV